MLRELNKRIKRNSFPIPKHSRFILKLKDVKYAASLDLTTGYYHIAVCPTSRKLCTTVIPWSKFNHQILPMGLYNSPDIFQHQKNESLNGLEYVRVFINELNIISHSNFKVGQCFLSRT